MLEEHLLELPLYLVLMVFSKSSISPSCPCFPLKVLKLVLFKQINYIFQHWTPWLSPPRLLIQTHFLSNRWGTSSHASAVLAYISPAHPNSKCVQRSGWFNRYMNGCSAFAQDSFRLLLFPLKSTSSWSGLKTFSTRAAVTWESVGRNWVSQLSNRSMIHLHRAWMQNFGPNLLATKFCLNVRLKIHPSVTQDKMWNYPWTNCRQIVVFQTPNWIVHSGLLR